MSIASKHAYRFGFLKSEKWKNIRLSVLAKRDAVCDICKIRDLSNDVHHLMYSSNWKDTPTSCMVVLCRGCHELVHKIQAEGSEGIKPASISKAKQDYVRLKRKSLVCLEGFPDPPKCDGNCEVCGEVNCVSFSVFKEAKVMKNGPPPLILCVLCFDALKSRMPWRINGTIPEMPEVRKLYQFIRRTIARGDRLRNPFDILNSEDYQSDT